MLLPSTLFNAWSCFCFCFCLGRDIHFSACLRFSDIEICGVLILEADWCIPRLRSVPSEEVYCAAIVLLGGKREHFCWCFCYSLIVFGDFGFWGLGKILFFGVVWKWIDVWFLVYNFEVSTLLVWKSMFLWVDSAVGGEFALFVIWGRFWFLRSVLDHGTEFWYRFHVRVLLDRSYCFEVYS